MKLSPFAYTNHHHIQSSKKQELRLLIWILIVVLLVALGNLCAQIIILMENSNPKKIVSWLAIFALWPFFGGVLYFILGYSGHRRKLFKRKHLPSSSLKEITQKQELLFTDHDVFFKEHAEGSKRLARLTLKSGRAPLSRNNDIRVLTNGEEKFAALFEDLENAQDHINLEYYIFRDDDIGTQLQNLLIRKAKAGVEVRVILDGLGSHTLPASFIEKMRCASIMVSLFFPLKFPRLFGTLNYRNHRKCVVIDGKIGYLGGLNIGDEYLSRDPKLGFWRDTHLRIEGESVQTMQATFLNDWYFLTQQELQGQSFYPRLEVKEGILTQILAGGPDSQQEPMKELFFTILATAKKEIFLATPYFIPDESMTMALKSAALSGLKVILLVQGKPDHQLSYLASASYFEELLKVGVQIYRYQKGILHCKVLIVDRQVSIVGSANFDIRSFQIDFELSALIYSSEIAERLNFDFHQDLQESVLIHYEEFSQRSLWLKMKESNASLLSPLL